MQDDFMRKLLAGLEKPMKHRIFLSYHHSFDQGYYDAFSKHFHDTLEAIHDKSLDKEIDSDNVDYVMRKIRDEYLTGTSSTIVLIGAETYTRKYIDWEIKATLDKEHALVGVYLPTAKRSADGSKIIVPGRLYDNVASGFASLVSWETITASANALDDCIKAAKAKSKSLIDNSREKKLKNG
ncbi:TIR domain-containing protein [Pseudomonas sp. LG1E9]|uniref:TIR domain-containing protein n=1 Tax=Pseudomonas sp. LG1E9 TaxID=2219057 RepID=UPI000DD41EB3|nr:TIR domain-containing protein [Pseudomonas sp. LG1E9]